MRQHRRPDQQIKPQCRAQKLRQVRRDGRHFRGYPEEDRHWPREMLPAVLRQRQPGNNAQLRRKILDEDGHRVRPQQHPQQPVSKPAAALDIGRKVSRIDICDRSHKGWPEVRPYLVPPEIEPARSGNRAGRGGQRSCRITDCIGLLRQTTMIEILHAPPDEPGSATNLGSP